MQCSVDGEICVHVMLTCVCGESAIKLKALTSFNQPVPGSNGSQQVYRGTFKRALQKTSYKVLYKDIKQVKLPEKMSN